MFGVIVSSMPHVHSVAVVIPVFNGRKTLDFVVEGLQRFSFSTTTQQGHEFKISEVILVFDHGTDGSENTLKELEQKYESVRVVWLTRNFGQHAATVAGLASTSTDWIVTMDEDGQHDPSDIPRMLDSALCESMQVVYAKPVNSPPHGMLRNLASSLTKGPIVKFLTGGEVQSFHSFRLISGEIGRILAAYVGNGVYLDVALQWVANGSTTCEVKLLEEQGRPSGYKYRSLLSHFWRLVLSSGTRLLRVGSLVGAASFSLGMIGAVAVIVGKLFVGYATSGWASVIVVLLVFGGLNLLFIGVVAEYIGLLIRTSIGKPLYVIGSDPTKSKLQN